MKLKSTIEDYNGEEDAEAHEKLVAAADWDGPVKERHCTDLLCLILLCVSWVAMTWVGIYAVTNGDYRLILYPLDYDGNVCGANLEEGSDSNGTGVDMTEYPYLYYVNSYTGGVCVKECPSLQGLTNDNLTDVRTLITYNGIWQTEDGLAELDVTDSDSIWGDLVANYSASDDAISCTTDLCFPDNDVNASWTSSGIGKGFGFAYYLGDTYPLFQRCILTNDAQSRISELTDADNDSVLDLVNVYDTTAFWTNLYGDLWTAKHYILGFGFGCSLVVSLVYLLLLRMPFLLTALVWFSIGSIIALFALAGYFALNTAQRWEAADPPTVRPEQIQYTEITGYVLFGISALLALIGCCLRGQIQLAIGCVKEAGKAINTMVLLLGVPLLQGGAFLVFWLVWGYFCFHLASLGDISTRSFPVDTQGTEVTIRIYEFDDFVTQCGWYMLFCFWWTASFIVAVGDMVVAMAVSKWYFTIDKSTISSATVLNALFTTMFFHLGTCAFGSLIIAIIKLIRAILAKLQKQIAQATNKRVAQCMLCCCNCCMCCLEQCMKFINKNAYIQTAIFGTSFCVSGRKAFFLILRNAARISAVSYVSAAVLVIGKLFISTLTTAVSYYCIVEYLEIDLYSYAGPVLLIFVISYFVADMFMDVFEIGILTILHCFVADEEMFGGQARYAEGGLSSWVDKNGAME
jgi:hypothetical protein